MGLIYPIISCLLEIKLFERLDSYFKGQNWELETAWTLMSVRSALESRPCHLQLCVLGDFSWTEQLFSSLTWSLCCSYWGGWLLGGFNIITYKEHGIELRAAWVMSKKRWYYCFNLLLLKAFLKICFRIDSGIALGCLSRHWAFHIFF